MSAAADTSQDESMTERAPRSSDAGAAPPAKRGSLRSTQKAVTRRLILEAAQRVFAEAGYHAASVDQITGEAGASRATFYLHFGTKADVLENFIGLATERYAEQYTMLSEIMRAPTLPTLRVWLLSAMDRWPDIADLMRPVFEATAAHPDLYQRFFPDDLPGNQEMRRSLLESGIVTDPGMATEVAAVMFAPLYHYMRVHLRGEPYPREAIADLIAGSWLAVIAAAER